MLPKSKIYKYRMNVSFHIIDVNNVIFRAASSTCENMLILLCSSVYRVKEAKATDPCMFVCECCYSHHEQVFVDLF